MDPIQQSAPAPMTPPNKKVGPIIALLVVVLILIIGALYLFAARVNKDSAQRDTMSARTDADTAEEVAPITNQADDTDSLEADLNASIQGVDNQNF